MPSTPSTISGILKAWRCVFDRQAFNIPLIVDGVEGIEDGRVESSTVGTTDIYATIADYASLGAPALQNSAARSLRPLLEGAAPDWRQAVFMEQEETRAVRTPEWLYMKRFRPSNFGFGDALYDLRADPQERHNRAEDPACAQTLAQLERQVDEYFASCADPKWDLWRGGRVKSNSTRPFFWQDVWGESWSPTF